MFRSLAAAALIASLVPASAGTAHAAPQVVVCSVGAAPAPVPQRTPDVILEDIHQALRTMAQGTALARRAAGDARGPARQRRLAVLRLRVDQAAAHLASLRAELDAALLVQPGGSRSAATLEPAVVVGPGVGSRPMPMAPASFVALEASLRDEAFDDTRLELIDDALRAGAFFTRDQGVTLVGLLTFSSNQVEAGARVCARVLEPGALPQMLAGMSFRSAREDLRERVQDSCRWHGPR